jgi:hypothetical protein
MLDLEIEKVLELLYFFTHRKEKPTETVGQIINLSNITYSLFESTRAASSLVTKEYSYTNKINFLLKHKSIQNH